MEPAAAAGPIERFYTDLVAFTDARDVCNLAHYHEVPDGWTVIVTDVEGSTKAIEAGRYRDVNLIGAATITAARNAVPAIDIAYVFGGDGATLLVPDAVVPAVRAALLGLQAVGIERFGLKLRVGGVKLAELRQRGAQVLVAKLEISRGLCLAMFAGGGLAEADRLVKKSPEHVWSAEPVTPARSQRARVSLASDRIGARRHLVRAHPRHRRWRRRTGGLGHVHQAHRRDERARWRSPGPQPGPLPLAQGGALAAGLPPRSAGSGSPPGTASSPTSGTFF